MVFFLFVVGVMVGLVGGGICLAKSNREVKGSRFLLQMVSRGLTIFNILLVVGFLTTQPAYAQEEGPQTDTHLVAIEKTTPGYGIGLLAAAIAVAVGALGGGIAVGMAASAGMGALSENPKLFGNILIFVGLAEGIAIYGLVVALFILQKL
ncbi:MAG: ATP synthase subunit C [Brevinematales bacterium]